MFFAAALNYVLPNASCNVYYFLLIKQNGTNKSVVVYIHQGMAVFHTWVEQVLTKVPGLGQALESKVLQYTICVDLNIKRQIFYILLLPYRRWLKLCLFARNVCIIFLCQCQFSSAHPSLPLSSGKPLGVSIAPEIRQPT